VSARGPSPSSAQAGNTSLVALFLALALGGLSVGLVQESSAARAAATRQESSLKALEIAEAGLARAEVEVRSQVDLGGDGIGNVAGSFANGSYEVTATPDPVSVDRVILRAKGTQALSVRRVEIGVRRRRRAQFVEGLFSKDGLSVNGNQRTDAYDSRLGTYASQATNTDGSGPYAMHGGHLGSNQEITIHGSANTIRGNVIPGPLHTVDLSGSPTITGDMIPRDEEIAIPDTPQSAFAAAVATNDNENWTVVSGSILYNATRYSLRVNNHSTLTLPGGTYFFSDLTLRSNASLQVTGACKIYVTGSLDLSAGSVLNTTGRPGDFLLYIHPYALPASYDPPTTEVKIAGHPQAAAAIYAPAVSLTISGGSEFFGAAVANDITLNGNTFFHYDVALGAIGVAPGATFERLYWRELSPPRR
jgi:hypothetical protein